MPEPVAAGDALKLISPTFIAGVLGAMLSLRFATNLNAYERATAVIGGAFIAQYATPIAAHLLNLDNFQQGLGFFIGLFGLSLTAAVYDTIKKADPWGLIMSRWGRSTDGEV